MRLAGTIQTHSINNWGANYSLPASIHSTNMGELCQQLAEIWQPIVQTMGVISHRLRGSTHIWEFYHVGAYSSGEDMTALSPFCP